MSTFNVYMTGVGGQGIGMLSEILLRAADHAGLTVKSVDTHGLAQRGGIVISQLRIGEDARTPLISAQSADLVVALERHEALRGARTALKQGGVLIYYDTVWQPLPVRLGEEAEVTAADIQRICQARQARLIQVESSDMTDVRMQNMVMLAQIARQGLISQLSPKHFLQAMGDLMDGALLEANQVIFEEQRQ
ncbi:MAG: 2-oxoacid:acceptor oxidoreductase family protein [Desulfobacteraceae bacterium]|nr:2-oxoacid:acceptor oxidoreductase family protein [Desulfobacteraceae bacterium]